MASGPGSGKDDSIGDSVHFAVFEVSCGDGNCLVYLNNSTSCTDIIEAEENRSRIDPLAREIPERFCEGDR